MRNRKYFKRPWKYESMFNRALWVWIVLMIITYMIFYTIYYYNNNNDKYKDITLFTDKEHFLDMTNDVKSSCIHKGDLSQVECEWYAYDYYMFNVSDSSIFNYINSEPILLPYYKDMSKYMNNIKQYNISLIDSIEKADKMCYLQGKLYLKLLLNDSIFFNEHKKEFDFLYLNTDEWIKNSCDKGESIL